MFQKRDHSTMAQGKQKTRKRTTHASLTLRVGLSEFSRRGGPNEHQSET